MSSSLKVAPCNFKAAEYAVTHWHYSECMPAGKTVKFGVWELGKFIGVVIYSRGANNNIGKAFKLGVTEVCELTRVALDTHTAPVSQILSKSLKLLSQTNPGLRLVISYADCDQGHEGIIYRANNWIYLGMVQLNGGTPRYNIRGKVMHGRSVAAKGWTQNIEWVREHVDANAKLVYTKGKHKYAMPLDRRMRRELEALRVE